MCTSTQVHGKVLLSGKLRSRTHLLIGTCLWQEKYDDDYIRRVYSYPVVELSDLVSNMISDKSSVRLTYSTKQSFKNIAKQLKIMDDFKVGSSFFVLVITR